MPHVPVAPPSTGLVSCTKMRAAEVLRLINHNGPFAGFEQATRFSLGNIIAEMSGRDRRMRWCPPEKDGVRITTSRIPEAASKGFHVGIKPPPVGTPAEWTFKS